MFDAAYCTDALAALERAGTRLAPPLDARSMKQAEAAFGCPFPPELRLLLSTAVPLGSGWIDWHEDPESIADKAAAHVLAAFEFDIREAQYWLDEFGPRLNDLDEAVCAAATVFAEWPRLIPIRGHRFMPSSPEGPGNPVLSVYQAVDSIYYGNDLADYLHREFGIERPEWARSAPREVPKWGRAFDL